MPISTK